MKKISDLKKTMVLSLLALFCFALLLFFLYHYDNKYFQKSPQPVSGQYYLTEEDFKEQSVFFPVEDWAFYPNALLTPLDFKNQMSDVFIQFVTIGEYNDFSMGRPRTSPIGSATYRLTLHLPQKPAFYSIALPEVFSAYTFYVNDDLAVQVGDPWTGSYKDAVGNRVVSFEGSGKVTLTLCVTNRNHFYSGLIYPPVFGTSQDVQHLLTVKLVLRSAFLMLLFTATILFSYFAFKIRDKRAGIFVLICLTTMGYTAYPVVFSIWTLPVQPWYSLELFCLYATYFLTLSLQNNLCGISSKAAKISEIALLTFCAAALLYTFPFVNTGLPHSVFVILVRCVKYFTVGYLLISSFKTVADGKSSFNFLLVSTAAFGVSVAFDRLFPLYEPIYGGWFLEYGGFFLVFGFGYVLWQEMTEAYRFQMTFTEEKNQLTRQIAIQKAHYLELTEKIDEAIHIRHDERHHFRTIYTLLENKDFEAMEKYLKSCQEKTDHFTQTVFCQNMISDAIFKYYQTQSDAKKIDFQVMAELPPELPLTDTDLSILLSNLIENAYEACVRQKTSDPLIRIVAKYQRKQLMLRIENSYETPVKMKNGDYLSTKHDGKGKGTISVRRIVESYGGIVNFKINSQIFQVSVLLSFME